MKTPKTITIITTIALTILWAFLAVWGCHNKTIEEREPIPEIVWPQPPEISRIRFEGFVSKPEHLKIKDSAIRRVFDYLAGKTNPTMMKPYGVETDSLGRLYVVDTALKTVHVFDTEGNEYYKFPTKGTRLVSPIDIAIDNQRGYIYISDSEKKVVKIFKGAGKVFVGEIGKGVVERPTGLAINNRTAELLVVDTLSANILRYDLDDFHLKGVFGGTGTQAGKLHYPTNIFVTVEGVILISDSLNFRIQLFSAEGKFLRMFGGEGDLPGYFTRPRGVASDSDGNIYVVDALFDNIQIFNNEGSLLMVFGDHGHGYGEFWLPTGIFIDHHDRIYISDSFNKRIQVFKYLKENGVLK